MGVGEDDTKTKWWGGVHTMKKRKIVKKESNKTDTVRQSLNV